jgi:hypothetical protein
MDASPMDLWAWSRWGVEIKRSPKLTDTTRTKDIATLM